MGSDFQKGYKIRAGGTLVLGQDQDKLAGDFDAEETFVANYPSLMYGTVFFRRGLLSNNVTNVTLPKTQSTGGSSLRILSLEE